MSESTGPVLLYDGYCAFCNGAVRMVLRGDDEGLFRFAPLDSDVAAAVIGRHPSLRGTDSLVLVENVGRVLHGSAEELDMSASRVHVRSDALLRSARLLGGAWKLLLLLAVIPRPIRDWAYDLFARWRYRLFGRYESCPLPPPAVRDRFLA